MKRAIGVMYTTDNARAIENIRLPFKNQFLNENTENNELLVILILLKELFKFQFVFLYAI